MKYNDPKPDIQRIEEIVTGVKTGDIKLPKFQRPFVWKRKEVINLFDSIYNGYPIGSILLWNSTEKLASERTIADLQINEKESNYFPTNYLLDGQQRISSLCGCLYWDGNDYKSLWNVVFDLEKEEFLFPKNESKVEYFPLNKFINTSDFILQCRKFENHPKKEKFFKNAENLLRSIKDYKIAVVKIGDMSINEVAPIFERINSTGRKLTIVDLMRAATWKNNFDLTEKISEIKKECEILGYYNIPDNHILRSISASLSLGINKEDVDKLRNETSEILSKASENTKIAYKKAVEFLKTQIGVKSFMFLPYGLQLTLLVEYFNLDNNVTSEKIEELKIWFWETSISRHFGTSNTGQNSRDLEKIRRFARNEDLYLNFDIRISVDKFLDESFRFSTSSTKTFILLLSLKNPMDFILKKEIDKSLYLDIPNNKFYNKLLNINNSINYFITSANDKIDLMKMLMNTNDENFLKSHFLTSYSVNLLREQNFEEFLKDRKKNIKAFIEYLIQNSNLEDEVEYDIYE
ncbi:DUF262 domain-containing protein [uncultured Chryseobacterium sp.]|uniref:GmrSD restriction endonuclease domain-containing protein n=1 Tax=uncultured Chryseobacterium sp. TaxID=259322 RepID=UPI003749F5BD